MKNLVIILIGMLCSSAIAISQEVISPSDMRKIVNESKVGYEFTQFEHQYTYLDLTLVNNGMVLHQTGSNISLAEYADLESYDVKHILADAELAVKEEKFTKARKAYSKALHAMPSHSQAMVYMGYTYELEENRPEAKKWYHLAIEENFINYEAHSALARTLMGEGKFEEALESALVAHILNKNDEKLLNDVNRISRFLGKNYASWHFTPQYHLIGGESGSVKVQYNGTPWKYYGLCKAFWMFEPGYREKQIDGVFDDYDMMEERECMSRAELAYDQIQGDPKLKEEIFPAMYAYKKSISHDLSYEYILFEIEMQENPYLGSTLTKGEIEKIKDYIMAVRLVDSTAKYKKV